ncbi:hypothetical protein BJY21_002579 [Kineosphaera limosa]|nr:hypothetical protein [Kineosphaera limosa]NYD99083.1 hypothetical protein [Kineosphaera limosa]NYE00351.1 hypothetical protein [Kineosphaera limosa]NYE01121.1 hypothetical protein [Kineosphaera limosa]NYE01395.1 hypothetical protein [Kineosphaera limosa]
MSTVFDEENLIGVAGLAPGLMLAESAGLSEVLAQRLGVNSPSAAVKASCVVAGMLAGADSIDDLDVLRHGGMGRVFCGVRAPSTLGTFLRAFKPKHVRQLGAVSGDFLVGLTARVPALLAGAGAITYLDIDDTIREVHGYAKEGAAYGYTGLKGLNAQIATLSTPVAAPVIAATRLREGNASSGSGAAALIRAARKVATACGVPTTGSGKGGQGGRLMVRADSAYYSQATVAAARAGGSWFSITARQDVAVQAAITKIADSAWTPITYPRAVADPETGELISDAQVAEIPYVAFKSTGEKKKVTCRLVVRRVRRRNGEAAKDQGELFTTWRFHAFITNSTLSTVDADRAHRDHALVEQVFAELKDGPLAHAPSGKFTANGAWLALTAMAFNLARALGALADTRHAKARWATIRAHLIHVPARVAASARRYRLHLPTNWPWAQSLQTLTRALGLDPPSPARS